MKFRDGSEYVYHDEDGGFSLFLTDSRFDDHMSSPNLFEPSLALKGRWVGVMYAMDCQTEDGETIPAWTWRWFRYKNRDAAVEAFNEAARPYTLL